MSLLVYTAASCLLLTEWLSNIVDTVRCRCSAVVIDGSESSTGCALRAQAIGAIVVHAGFSSCHMSSAKKHVTSRR